MQKMQKKKKKNDGPPRRCYIGIPGLSYSLNWAGVRNFRCPTQGWAMTTSVWAVPVVDAIYGVAALG